MKLFVWNKPIRIPYGGTCLYVVAETEQEARKVAKKATQMSYGEIAEHDPVKFDAPLGPPTRVIEAPCAELYYWSE